MANLVLAIGTPFSPLLAIAPEDWVEYCKGDLKRQFNKRDGTFVSYEQLRAENGDRYASQATLAEFRRRSSIGQAHLERLVAEVAAAKPDVAIVIGDDHSELFDGTNLPVISVYRSPELANAAGDRRTSWYLGKEQQDAPQWRRDIQAIQAIEPERHYPGHPACADALVRGLIDQHVDVAVATEPKDPHKAGLGFAWGFVINRYFAASRVPVVPVVLNPRYAPNVPTPARCYEIGQALQAAIAAIEPDLRVVVICGGGLSHLGIDEDLDRTMLEASVRHDVATLSALPRAAMTSGSCQLLNWIVLAGVAHRLQNRWTEYVPVYRTSAGTGIGLAFASWS